MIKKHFSLHFGCREQLGRLGRAWGGSGCINWRGGVLVGGTLPVAGGYDDAREGGHVGNDELPIPTLPSRLNVWAPHYNIKTLSHSFFPWNEVGPAVLPNLQLWFRTTSLNILNVTALLRGGEESSKWKITIAHSLYTSI